MKKLVIIMAILLASTIFAEQVKIKYNCPTRVSDTSSVSAGDAKTGEVFPVLEKTGAWWYVKIISGDDDAGKEGWIYRELIDTDLKIKGTGAKLHVDPNTDSPLVCVVNGGALVEKIKVNVKWYKIGDARFVYYIHCELVPN